MVTETKAITVNLEELVSRFLASRQRLSRSPHSLSYYGVILTNFQWYARTNKWPEDIGALTRGHMREFLDYVASESFRWPSARRCSCKPASTATVHHYGKVVKNFFNWAEEEEYLEQNPLARFRLAPPKYRQVEPYTDDEVKAIIEVCKEDARYRYRYLGIRNLAIISLFVATGLRLEELSEIMLSDFDPRLQQLEVNGKGGKIRLVPINGEARKALRRYLELREPGGDELWKTGDGQVMNRHSVATMIGRLKKRAGLADEGGAHRFRHYFATRYLDAGGDINSLRLLLGHATLTMVLRYSKFAGVKRALIEHEQFNPLDRLYNGGQNNNGGRRGYRQ